MSKFGGALKKLQTVQAQTAESDASTPDLPKTGKPESMETGKPASTKTGEAESPQTGLPERQGPEREKYSTYLNSELVTALKLHAVRHRMKHHHVVEAALRAYLKDRE